MLPDGLVCPLSTGNSSLRLLWEDAPCSRHRSGPEVGTKADANHLVHHGNDVIGNVGAFKVASAATTLSADALGYGMERNQGNG